VYVRGIVQTPDARPISGARIVLASPKGRAFYAKTDTAGCFHLGGVTAPGRYRYSFVATAESHESVAVDVRTLHDSYVLATLVPDKTQPGSKAEVIELDREALRRSGRPCGQE
jgi:hypothetical protein